MVKYLIDLNVLDSEAEGYPFLLIFNARLIFKEVKLWQLQVKLGKKFVYQYFYEVHHLEHPLFDLDFVFKFYPRIIIVNYLESCHFKTFHFELDLFCILVDIEGNLSIELKTWDEGEHLVVGTDLRVGV